MSDNKIIARPYAKATFAFALDNDLVDDWFELLQGMAAIVSHHAVVQLIKSPKVDDTAIADVALKVCSTITKKTVDNSFANFIKVVATNKRMLSLPSMMSLFAEFRAQHEKSIAVEVMTFNALDETQQQQLQDALEKRFAKKVSLDVTEDKSLLGGLLIKAGDQVIDGSVRGKLNRLINHLHLKEELCH